LTFALDLLGMFMREVLMPESLTKCSFKSDVFNESLRPVQKDSIMNRPDLVYWLHDQVNSLQEG